MNQASPCADCAALPVTSDPLSSTCRVRCTQGRLPRKLKRRGVAAVEFAVVAPIFFIFTMGIVEVGRLVMVQQVLTTASREGARVAILDSASTSSVQAAVSTYLSNVAISGATTTVSPTTLSSALPGDPVTVTVSINYANVSWLPSPWFFSQSTLTAQTQMRREGIR